LPPGAAVGVPVGLEIAVSSPAIIGTVRMGAELGGGVDLTRTASRREDQGWRSAGRRGTRRGSLLTGHTVGFVDEARKRWGVAGALTGWRGGRGGHQARDDTGQGPRQHDLQPQESQEQQLVEKPIRYHGTSPSSSDEMGKLYLIFGLRNYPQATGTRPSGESWPFQQETRFSYPYP
jgi:hypothetical protein